MTHRQAIACALIGLLFACCNHAGTTSTEGRPISPLPKNVLDPAGVWCGSQNRCVVIANSPVRGGTAPTVVTTSEDGSRWLAGRLPTGLSNLYGITCMATSRCVAVGGAGGADNIGAVALSTDGGRTWSQVPLPTGTPDLLGVSCGSATSCVAVGSGVNSSGVYVTGDGGSTWSAATITGGTTSGFSGISCLPSRRCVAVGSGAIFSTDGGSRWAEGTLPTGTTNIQAITCVASLVCAAVSSGESSPWGGAGTGSGVYTKDGGVTWSTSTVPKDLFGLEAVACADQTSCAALGIGVAVVTSDGGKIWTRAKLANDAAVITGVSCPIPTLCVAVGTDGPTSDTGQVMFSIDRGITWR